MSGGGRFLLGVDSGGSKCEAFLTDDSGRILGRGRRDHRNRLGERHLGGMGRADQTVSDAIEDALRGAQGIGTLHVAGRSSVVENSLGDLVTEVFYHPIREQDAPMALVGATSGLVLLAGTGAFVFGRSPTGEELLLDAIGPLYGDHGGAFQIGLAAVRASGRSDWHERFATSLGRVIPVACKDLAGEPNDFSMVHYMLEARDRSEIASLAKLVNCEAESGDRIAKAILIDAADDMIETVSCVVERLSLNGRTMPLIGSGGVAVHSDTYWNRVVERVSEFAPDLNPVRSIHQPALGLILAMAGELDLDSPSFREHLLGTQGPS